MNTEMLHGAYVSTCRDGLGGVFRRAWVLNPNGHMLPFPTAFGSWLYDPEGKLADPDIGEIVTDEFVRSPYTGVPARVCPNCYVGEEDWFLGDWPSDAPPVVLEADGWADDCSGGCMGCVKRVGLAADPTFVVSGSPVESTGTLSLDWALVPAGYSLQGPASGSPATPTFKPASGGGSVVMPGEGIQVDVALPNYSVSHLWGQGRPNKAQRFSNSTSCNLSGSGFSSLPDPSTGDFTVAFMARSSVPGQTACLATQTDSSGISWYVYMISGQTRFAVTLSNGSGASIQAPTVLGDGQWHVIIVSWNSSTGEAALVQDNNGPVSVFPGITPFNARGLMLGGYLFSGTVYDPFDGDIAEFAMWDHFYNFYFYPNLYNGGCGYLYRQLPCDFANPGPLLFFDLEELGGISCVDLVGGLVLVQGGTPTTDVDGVCGMRIGCAGYIEADHLIPGTLPPGVEVPVGNVEGPGTLDPTISIDPVTLLPGTLPSTVIVPISNISPPIPAIPACSSFAGVMSIPNVDTIVFTATNAGGIIGQLTMDDQGTSGLFVTLDFTDLAGNVTHQTSTIPPATLLIVNFDDLHNNFPGPAFGPMQSITIKLRSPGANENVLVQYTWVGC